MCNRTHFNLQPSPLISLTLNNSKPESMASSGEKRLEGKVAIITGGASGIGKATAKLFVGHGAKVIIADIQDELGHSVCQQLGSEDLISYIHCDITCDSDVQKLVDFAVSKYGSLDIMFNNAGIFNMGSEITSVDNETFKRILEVNVFGSFLGAKHAARVMIPNKKGCILFTASIAALIHDGLTHAYTASKCALVGLAKNLCVELGQHGIRVNCISPYGVTTPIWRQGLPMLDEQKLQDMMSSAGNLKGVTLTKQDIAEAALYLSSDEAKYVSGLNLVVDGGYTVTNPSFSNVLKFA